MAQTIKTKSVMWNGKKYEIKFTDENYKEFLKEATICKLNGWDFDKMLRRLPSYMREGWPEMAAKAFAEVSPTIEVGLPATEILWSDRRAKTIIKVISPKEIVVQENETECIDYYAGDYKILPQLATYMGEETYTLRRNGTWVAKGQPKKNGSVVLIVGMHNHYIDPSF